MKFYICSVWNTAYRYRDKLKKYNYEHVIADENEIKICEADKDYNRDINDNNEAYNDYITLNSIEEIEELVKDVEHPIVVSNKRGILEITIYDDWLE